MKNVYINSRLDSIAIAARPFPPNWIFSIGRRWLLLTPRRLHRLATWLGLEDRRIDKIVHNVRRYSGRPESFCKPLGIETDPYYRPADYPLALCPACDSVHHPHPLDAYQPCLECVEKERQEKARQPGPFVLRDLRADRLVRERLLENDPDLFVDGKLSPHWKATYSRRLDREWDAAINRILMGGSYRAVAKEFVCSVGLLHKKVKEHKYNLGSWDNQPWENN